MSATARLLVELVPEVVAAPQTDGRGYVVALVLGGVLGGPDEAEAVADHIAARVAEAVEQDLAAPLHVPAERLALPS